MPIESVLFVGLVIGALAEFAAVLTYAEWATRHATDDTPRRGQIKRDASVHNGAVSVRKAA
jgi:hypothetical protein